MDLIGIDPGKKGGIAIVKNLIHVELYNMPLLLDNSLDSVGLQMIFRHTKLSEDCICFLEKAQCMPKQGVKGVFNYGMDYGIIRAVLELSNIKYQEITPQRWKKYFGLGKDKKESIVFAFKLFPGIKDKFYTKRGRQLDGLAEALLLTEYGRRNLNIKKEDR